MHDYPTNKLDPKIKNTWRIADAILMVIIAAAVLIPLIILAYAVKSPALDTLVNVAMVALAAITVVVIAVLPTIRYARWSWAVTDDYLEIAKGIIWRRRTVIPFIRVQNTDTRQGPLMRIWKLADVTVSTAAGEHVIPGLDAAAADELRDRAAELARIAREDI